MNREEYIFIGISDAILYFFIYILIPFVQIVVGMKSSSIVMHIFALISMIGLFYDCHTRFNYNMEKTAKRKIFWIGLSSITLLALSISAIVVFASDGIFPEFLNVIYGSIVVPLFICIHDAWYVAKDSMGLL